MRKADLHFDDTMMLNQETAEAFYDYIDPLPDNGRLLEIGYGWGHSARFFSMVKPGWFIYSVDSFGLYGDGRIYQELNHDKVKNVLEYNSDRSNIINILGDSAKIPWELPLDILYIDAGHTYDACKADFLNYSPFLKFGGLCIFDDYSQPGFSLNGVKQVVDEILQDYELLYTGIAAIVRKI